MEDTPNLPEKQPLTLQQSQELMMMFELLPVEEVDGESQDWLDVTDELLAAVEQDLQDCELICDVNTLNWNDSLHSTELMDHKMDPRC